MAKEWRAAVPTGIMLERARRILGADVPGEVVAQLVTSRTRRAANRVVDRLSPPQQSRSQRSGSALWAQSLRDTTPNAMVLVGRLRRRASHDGRMVARARREATGARLAVFQPAGDQDSRTAFFERVGGSPGGDR